MLFPERMKKIELLVLKSDVNGVMRYLGFAGCMQLIVQAEGSFVTDAISRDTAAAELRLKVESIARFLGIEEAAEGFALDAAPAHEDLRARAMAVADAVKDLVDEESGLVQRRLSLKQTADELASFGRMKVPFSDFEGLSWLVVRTGTVAPERLELLAQRLRKRALVLPLGRPGQFLAVAPRKGRWALDSELRRLDFQESRFPEGARGTPAGMLPAVEADIAAVDRLLETLDDRKTGTRDALRAEIQFLLVHLGIDASIDAVTQGLASSGSVQKITGWVPARRFPDVSGGLDALTHGRLALRSWDPEELPEVKSGAVRVPVFTPHGRVVRGFDRMVLSYSVPLYGTIDPAPFVAVMFVLLFAIMFGDVGQGSIGVLLGLIINSGRVRAFADYRRKNFGTVFIVAGAASMVAGLLYGSVFANESLLVPVTRFVTERLVGRPLDRVISLEGFQKITLFFGVTIGIGVVINSVGLVINMANTMRRREWEKALLSKTGAAGAFFFWYALFIVVRLLLGGHLAGVDFLLLGLPLAALFFREPIVHLSTGHRPVLKEGLFSFVMEGIAEVLESAIYFVSNSISFLRVAAFALAHTVLSTIIVLLARMVGSPPAGAVFSILIFVLGNSIIIVLEGLIVAIQVVRLQYYEFFSKFFTESGEEFTPFILRAPGGST